MRLVTILAATLALWATSPSLALETPTQNPAPARQVVETLDSALLDVMRNAQKLGFKGRFEQLSGVLKKIYDFPNMTRIVTGSNWKAFSPEQRAALADAYMRMSIATYATRLNGYSGEKFEIQGTDIIPPPSPAVLVRTRLIKNGGGEVKLNYRLHTTDEGWRIVDVFYNGSVSELAAQRSQYLDILKSKGYDGLMKTLEQKIADLAAGKSE